MTIGRAAQLLLPLACYCAHACLYGTWIIDDAAISFAYARNLAAGEGLVAQPGVAPVEGYSNPLWVAVMAGWHLLGLFDPVWTPKATGLVLVGLTYWLVARLLAAWPAHVTLLALGTLSLNPAFVIWTISGLENSLLAFLFAAMMVGLASDRSPSARSAAWCGVLVALLALTRPEAILMALAYPLHLLLARTRPGPFLRASLVHGLVVACLCGGFLVFRWLYFADVVPNTFHAKADSSLYRQLGAVAGLTVIVASLVAADRAAEAGHLASRTLRCAAWLGLWVLAYLMHVHAMTRAVAHELGLPLVALTAVLALGRLRTEATLRAPLSTALVAGAMFFALPRDWMGEYRFATGFVVSWHAFGIPILAGAAASLLTAAPRRATVAVATIAVVHLSLLARRAWRYVPAMPMSEIAADQERYESWSRELRLATPTILSADVGGRLYFGSLRVYDLAGLCDRTIARTIERDRAAFFAYVFESARPTFITMNATTAARARLQQDRRFRRDYAPIVEHAETGAGEYVRRDALPDEAAVEILRTR